MTLESTTQLVMILHHDPMVLLAALQSSESRQDGFDPWSKQGEQLVSLILPSHRWCVREPLWPSCKALVW